MKIIKVTKFDMALAKTNISFSKDLNKEINSIIEKVANAKKEIDKFLLEQETQYILKD